MIIKFLHAIGLTNLSDADVSKYYETPTASVNVTKRLLDIGVSLLLLIAEAPALLIISLLIKITSPGPVLFVQERMGLNKRRFRMYKFRIMVANAVKKPAELEHLNEVAGPVFRMKNDPRISPIGRFLRRTGLDEIPLLINVLKGDMSLVGPRPIPVRVYEDLDQDWHHRRFSIRPGITGLWQIQGRSPIPFEKWLELDKQYIDHWSLWLDLKLLAKTILVVLGISTGTDLIYPHGGSDKFEEGFIRARYV